MKKFRILYILLAILAILAIVVMFTDRSSTWKKIYADFAISDTASVYRVFLADKAGNQSDLIRLPNGRWEVNGKYEVRDGAVQLLLETMQKLTVKQAVARSAHNNVVSRLSATATKVEIYQRKPRFSIGKRKFMIRDRLSKVYYVGGATQDNRGTYMLMSKSSRPFVMYIPGFRGFLNTRYSTKETDWRSHQIFRYRLPEISSIQVEFPSSPDQSFRVESSGGKNISIIHLESGTRIEHFDTIKALDFLVSFADVRFENFLSEMPEEMSDSITGSQPMHIITVTDKLGVKNRVITFPKASNAPVQLLDGQLEQFDLDRLYALINDGQDLVLGQYFVFDRIVQPLSFYLPVP